MSSEGSARLAFGANSCRSNCIPIASKLPMIVGNPNAGKTIATAAVAVFLMMILITAIVCFRKRTAPVKEPPLHPSVMICGIL